MEQIQWVESKEEEDIRKVSDDNVHKNICNRRDGMEVHNNIAKRRSAATVESISDSDNVEVQKRKRRRKFGYYTICKKKRFAENNKIRNMYDENKKNARNKITLAMMRGRQQEKPIITSMIRTRSVTAKKGNCVKDIRKGCGECVMDNNRSDASENVEKREDINGVTIQKSWVHEAVNKRENEKDDRNANLREMKMKDDVEASESDGKHSLNKKEDIIKGDNSTRPIMDEKIRERERMNNGSDNNISEIEVNINGIVPGGLNDEDVKENEHFGMEQSKEIENCDKNNKSGIGIRVEIARDNMDRENENDRVKDVKRKENGKKENKKERKKDKKENRDSKCNGENGQKIEN